LHKEMNDLNISIIQSNTVNGNGTNM